jgi:D-alanyl-D-alanine carboxypeptidase/D-alanyl-D-alanine-endopeptidase (penicillin-binding protein 4)
MKCVSGIILLLFSQDLLALNSSDMKARVEKFISSAHIEKAQIGISIFYKGSEIVDLNAGKKFIPASVTKLFTALSVLEHIPPGTKFITRLTSSAKKEKETLKGDLYLVGAGDSGFVSESMWYLVNAFNREQIKNIEGDIVVDDSLFDDKRFDESREDHRVDRAYDAPVGAMSLNWNSVNIFIRPGEKNGDKALVTIDPENEYIQLSSEIKTGKTTDYAVDRKTSPEGRDLIRVSGKIAEGSNEIVVYKSITDPKLWAGYNLKQFLKEKGITVKGKIRAGKSPVGARTLAESPSKPIEQLLADMNKFSNNFVAEMLTKQVAAFNGVQGSLPAGLEYIRESVRGAGVTESEFEILNPSGLTRENQFSPRALVKVLEKVRKDFRLFSEYVSSLPIAGVDGTLKNRMKEGRSYRWVRAKTGLLTGVVSLAGYIGLESGDAMSFAFIYNGSKDGAFVRNTYDRLISVVLLDP